MRQSFPLLKIVKLSKIKIVNKKLKYINTSESCYVFDQSTAVSHNYDY